MACMMSADVRRVIPNEHIDNNGLGKTVRLEPHPFQYMSGTTTRELQILSALDGDSALGRAAGPFADNEAERIDETVVGGKNPPASKGTTFPARPLTQCCHRHISNVNVLREVSNPTSVSVLIEGRSHDLAAKAWGTAFFYEFQDQDDAYLEAYDRASALLKELLRPESLTEAPEDRSRECFSTGPGMLHGSMPSPELPTRRAFSLDGKSHPPVSGNRRSISQFPSQNHIHIGGECKTTSTTAFSQAPHVTEPSETDDASCDSTMFKIGFAQPHSQYMITLLSLMRQLRTYPGDKASSISNDGPVGSEDMAGAPVTRRGRLERHTVS